MHLHTTGGTQSMVASARFVSIKLYIALIKKRIQISQVAQSFQTASCCTVFKENKGAASDSHAIYNGLGRKGSGHIFKSIDYVRNRRKLNHLSIADPDAISNCSNNSLLRSNQVIITEMISS